MPLPLRPRITARRSVSPTVTLVLLAGWCAAVQAEVQICPASAGRSAVALTPAPISRVDPTLPIDVQADNWEAAVAGVITLTGHVVAQQGMRTLTADGLHFDPQTNAMEASGTVTFDDPVVRLSSAGARMDQAGGAQMENAQFWLKQAAGHGQADRLSLSPQGNLSLDNVSYTSCPPQGIGWELKLSDLDINQASQTGTGRNVRLKFAGATIFYSPWLSFPVGNQRKSGFLFPVLGSSSRGGQSVAVPWYWNIAANMDDTITPIIDTARGLKLDNELRYLGEHSKGKLLTGYLPYDRRQGDWRGYLSLGFQQDLTDAVRLKLQGQTVRDRNWFEDFGESRDETSLIYLNRDARLLLYGEHWSAGVQVANLQILDSTLDNSDHPYTRLPTLSVHGDQPLGAGVELQLDSELSYFTRGELTATDANGVTTSTPSVTGSRAYLAPTLRWPWRSHGVYVTPQIGWRYTGYQLQHVVDGQASSPSLAAPMYALDTGLTLQRLGGRDLNRIYTLEPRMLYAYVPYRDQRKLATVFDTTLPNFDQTQVFETNRFVGPDRLGDANQLSAGVTTRMLDAGTGNQYLAATLGQVYYFTTPCVTSLTQLVCDSSSSRNASDVFGQVTISQYRHVNLSFGAQWSPATNRSDQRNLALQYRLDGSRTANLIYRFTRDSVEQWEASTAWPLTRAISGYARVVYSQLEPRKVLDRFAGLEYRSCCWNVRAVVGRAVTTRSGEFDTQFKLQLELKGLSSLGTADSFLRNAIPGYAPVDP